MALTSLWRRKRTSKDIEIPFDQEDFEVFSKTKDESIVLGINIGMDIETRSRNFYQSVMRKISPDRRIMLTFLANEELNHPKTLLSLKLALQKNNAWLELNEKQQSRITMPRIYEGKGGVPFIAEDANDDEIILAATRAEKRTEEFYDRIGEKVKNPKAKAFFNILARFERSHYSILRNMLKASSAK